VRTEIIQASRGDARARALAVLESGGLVAFPTDTVYGLAADPWNERAVRSLYQVKARPKTLPIPLLLSSPAEIERVAVLLEMCSRLPVRFWPGGLTLLLPKRESVIGDITDRATVGVRVPDHSLALEIIGAAGGVLAVTSANLSGGLSPVTAREVEDQLGGRIPLILDGGHCRGGVPSTVLDCSVAPPRLVRRGAIDEEALRAVVGELVGP